MVQLKSYFKISLFLFSVGLFIFSLFSFFNTNNLDSFNEVILINNTNENLTYIQNNLDSTQNNKNLSITTGDKVIVKIPSNNFSFFLKDFKGKIYESKNFFIDFENENDKTIKILISKKFDDKFDFLFE